MFESQNWQQTNINLGTNPFGKMESLAYLVISAELFYLRVVPQNSFEPRWEIRHNQNEITSVNFVDSENIRQDLQTLEMTENIKRLALQILQSYINSQ